MILCVTLLFVFFFKQKTAYEMRISDWSSDVCSSDLQYCGAHRPRPAGLPPHHGAQDGQPVPLALRAGRRLRLARAPLGATRPPRPGAIAPGTGWATEIGSASCRERVCRLV